MKFILLILLNISAVSGVLLNSKFFKRNDFFYYFTNISNTLVAIYYVFELFPNNPIGNKYIQFTITMSILVTFIIYHFIISKDTRERKDPEEMKDYNSIENRLVHYITPFIATLYYLIYAKESIRVSESTLWLVYPFVYTSTMFIRAKFGTNIPDRDSKYPYDFLDVDKNGAKKVVIISIAMFTFFLILGIIMSYVKYIFL